MSGASIETTLEPWASSLGDVKGPKQRVILTAWCPAKTSIDTLVKVEGHRWAIEDSFETAKNELGLDHNETRSWDGWHRQSAGSATDRARRRHRLVAMAKGTSSHTSAHSNPATSCWRTAATTATSFARPWQTAAPGPTSSPCRTAKTSWLSRPSCIATRTPWSASSTRSDTTEAPAPDTTRTQRTTSPASSSP